MGLDPTFDQPIGFENWSIAFVGELLNYKELEPDLACDTPLAVKTWMREGPKGFSKFDGFWSIAAIDRRNGNLHLLTDYLAQKPIYYRTDTPSAASEPTALVDLAPTTPNETYFAAVHKWGYAPDGSTPWREIHKVAPGSHVVIAPDGFVLNNQVVDPIQPRPVEDEVSLLEALWLATRRRVQADVPVALLASGGLDSSIVYHLMGRTSDAKVYHVDNGTEEAGWFRTMGVPKDRARQVQVDGHDIEKRKLSYMQEPLDLGSLGPQVALADAIHTNDPDIRVVLTGDGADELFGGYTRAQHYDSQASDVWHELVHYHLPRLDRVMMRRRLEVRTPFLARSVVEIAFGLPRARRINKAVLRDLFRQVLPPGVADQPKRPLKTQPIAENRMRETIELVRVFRGMVQ